MPVLRNPGHERFARLRAEGKNASQAWRESGYANHRQSAHRALTYADVQSRTDELMKRTGKKHTITIGGIVEDLETACEQALALGQPSVVVSAQALKARLAGLDRERIEISESGRFASCSSEEEIVAMLVEGEDVYKLLDGLRELVAKIEARLADRAELIEPRSSLTKTDSSDSSR